MTKNQLKQGQNYIRIEYKELIKKTDQWSWKDNYVSSDKEFNDYLKILKENTKIFDIKKYKVTFLGIDKSNRDHWKVNCSESV